MNNLEIFIDKVQVTLTNFRNEGLLVYDWRDPAREPCVESMYDTFSKNPTSDDPETLQKLLHYRREFPSLWETANDPETRKDLLKWIVCNWGGINNIKCTTLKEYVKVLKPETYSSSKYFKNNISSFSKCLAFIDPSKCYVYDSRVALALNCLSYISNLHQTIVFKQPSSKSTYTTTLSRLINDAVSRSNTPLDYFEYCQVVRRLAGVSDTSDKNYIAAHKIEAELFMLGGWIRDQMRPLIKAKVKDNELEQRLRSLF